MIKLFLNGKYVFWLLCFLMIILAPQSPGLVRKVEIWADEISLKYENDQLQQVQAAGNCKLLYNDSTLKGNFAIFNIETQDFIVEDDVIIEAADYVVTADYLEGNSGVESFLLRGNIIISGQDIEIRAEKLDYADEKLLLTEKLIFVFADFTAEANQLTYNLADDYLLLTGNVTGKNRGQEFSAAMVEFNLEEKTIILKGEARFIF